MVKLSTLAKVIVVQIGQRKPAEMLLTFVVTQKFEKKKKNEWNFLIFKWLQIHSIVHITNFTSNQLDSNLANIMRNVTRISRILLWTNLINQSLFFREIKFKESCKTRFHDYFTWNVNVFTYIQLHTQFSRWEKLFVLGCFILYLETLAKGTNMSAFVSLIPSDHLFPCGKNRSRHTLKVLLSCITM